MKKISHFKLNFLFLCFLISFHNTYSLTSKNQFNIASAPILYSKPEDYDIQCDLEIEGPICSNIDENILMESSHTDNLIFNINFDQIIPVDISGNAMHPSGTVLSGPSFTGNGNSGLFTDGSYLIINNKDNIIYDNYALSFWMFAYDNSGSATESRFCPIFEKGNNINNNEHSLSIYYDFDSNRLQISYSTKDNPNENFFINSKLFSQRWYHIVLSKEGDTFKVYVNGILDSTKLIMGKILYNDSPYFIGNTPSTSDSCKNSFLLNNIKLYSTNINEDIIQSEASPSLGGLRPNHIQLGCLDCLIEDAQTNCGQGYYLCTSLELRTGGYQIARNMGWINWDTYIWSKSALEKKGDYKKIKGLGLCCKQTD